MMQKNPVLVGLSIAFLSLHKWGEDFSIRRFSTLHEAGVFCGEGQLNRYVKMVFKEWRQLQRNCSEKKLLLYFINYIVPMGDWNFWLEMRGEQLIEGTIKN